MAEPREEQEMSAADRAFADRVWGPGNWVRHMCSVNGDTPRMVIHSTMFHGTEGSDE